MWKNAVTFPEKGNKVYAVPVKSLTPNREIEAIWFFSISTEGTKYHIYTRDRADGITRLVGDEIEQTWMFDYFTRYALHKEPASGLKFILPKQSTRTLEAVLTCVDMYVGTGWTDGPENTSYNGTHCWYSGYEETEPWSVGGAVDLNGTSGSIDLSQQNGGGNSSNNNGNGNLKKRA